ncbi:baseplate assembly protein [Actinoplanes lobatus]|uniref:Baseplate assembly protein n=1 Tax=Actinoplanes lobatus TaxID=113568 RepID=A0A7W7HJ53_9ACTN|nr:phage baseplate assembly protein V [Actinoplanes lobatus]MBB4751479.1 putative cofactor-binding repeat protein [Actinoplanes lobatus]GGN64303.1 baseplate assembly protein [Actinoplanes lobatus]GIE41088.1 baseplate assembly protein [Actinoplanes lobatus]
MPEPSNRFLGKYRGRVVDNADPRRIARLRAEVPDVLGREWSTWALPCLPFTGEGFGHFSMPAVGAGVWIEFEQGDPSHPIWSGTWYGDAAELPPDARTAQEAEPPTQPVVIQTRAGHKVVVSDTAGGGILLRAGGASVRIDGGGVRLEDGLGGVLTVSGGRVDVNGQIFPGRA